MSFLSSSRPGWVGAARWPAVVVTLVLVSLVSPACGKRGDPLPPLRPIPNAPEALVVRQVGSKLFLEWTAPNRNHDGTTEKLELREAEIFRRVLDLPRLIEEQTVYPSEEEPSTEESGEDSTDPSELAPVAPDPVPAAGQASSVAQPESSPGTITSRVERPRPLGQEPAWTSATPPELLPAPPEDELLPGQATLSDPTNPFAASVTAGLPAAAPTLQLFDFRIDSKSIATVPSTVPGETASFEEELDDEWLGLRVEYAVLYVNRKNRPGPLSTIAQIEPEPPLPPPLELSAVPKDGFVSLSWAAGTDPEERELAFAVFRRSGDAEAFSETRLNEPLLTDPEFQDHTAVFGSRWCYVVRSVLPPPPPPEPLIDLPEGLTTEQAEALSDEVAQLAEAVDPDVPVPPEAAQSAAEAAERLAIEALARDTETEPPAPPVEPEGPIVPVVPPLSTFARIESMNSAEVCLVPEDVFAPPAPTGLVAVSGGAGILLSWRHVGVADAAGYHVYRASEPGGPFKRLNESLLETPSFTDTTAQIGETYYYAVTAEDSSPEANESERSPAARATHTP